MKKLYNQIKKSIPSWIKTLLFKIYYIPKYHKRNNTIRKLTNTDSKAVFVLGTPEYGNVGDYAISIAEIKFINNMTDNIECFEITNKHCRFAFEGLIKNIKPKDIIVITGGGFMGTLWLDGEILIRKLISAFPNNKIIIFPQTIYYENSIAGNNELSISCNIYQSHKDLHIFLRDKKSYDFCQNNLLIKKKTNCYLAPDMALYLNTKANTKRNGILICLRNDKESILYKDDKNKIISAAKKASDKISFTDTIVNNHHIITTREQTFDKKLKEFSKAELVITDRLHGMLFCSMTKTPCIVFNNVSQKVKGVYDEWLSELDNIIYLDDISTLYECANYLLNKKDFNFNNNIINYDNIKDVLTSKKTTN